MTPRHTVAEQGNPCAFPFCVWIALLPAWCVLALPCRRPFPFRSRLLAQLLCFLSSLPPSLSLPHHHNPQPTTHLYFIGFIRRLLFFYHSQLHLRICSSAPTHPLFTSQPQLSDRVATSSFCQNSASTKAKPHGHANSSKLTRLLTAQTADCLHALNLLLTQACSLFSCQVCFRSTKPISSDPLQRHLLSSPPFPTSSCLATPRTSSTRRSTTYSRQSALAAAAAETVAPTRAVAPPVPLPPSAVCPSLLGRRSSPSRPLLPFPLVLPAATTRL
jgi:hypothetical protein